ncbi:MAG TPA: type VI secretion system-associated protein TagF [Steroidobacter sp.]|uniref:type VI secretion system-associated protein TagF n=1 Tax=Steroidobacter sp. TaxID=1978227 RepID=UPI002ED7FAA2
MTSAAIDIGFYGKLPCRGDFLQRRAPSLFVDAWDAWLQECMHASKEQLGEAWLDAYLTGPVWRFVLDAGVCGDACYAGVLVPSVDRVGRYFPLTVVAQLAAGHCPLDVACGAGAWFEAAEALVIEALEAEAVDIEAFDERVAGLSAPLAAEHARESASLMQSLCDSAFPAQALRWHVPLESAQSLQRAVNVLAYREMNRGLKPLTLWWTEGSQAVGASWLALRGLPEATAFGAMLSGDWSRSSWTSPAEMLV